MIELKQSSIRNRLLKSMAADDFARLQPHLQSQPIRMGLVLIRSDTLVEQLYFPERGLISLTTPQGKIGRIEIGMIGREGLVGAVPVLLGVDRSPHDSFVQMPGEVLSISTQALQAFLLQSPGLNGLLLRYVHTLVVQTAQTAFANAAYTIDVRLARWLLMYHDRGEGDDMVVTHEFLSIMLGVRRPGVSVAIQILEGKHLIKATRGSIRVLDRAGLEAKADTSYGVAEAEYARLFALS